MIPVVAEQTGVLRRLHGLMDLEEEALKSALLAEPGRLEGREVFTELIFSGRRPQGRPEEYALLIESIFEGYLLHYGRGRLMAEGSFSYSGRRARQNVAVRPS